MERAGGQFGEEFHTLSLKLLCQGFHCTASSKKEKKNQPKQPKLQHKANQYKKKGFLSIPFRIFQ